MKPLSRKKRTLYFIFFTSILIVVSPILVFYSMGYRFDTILGFGQVGGIYAESPMTEVDFSLNNKILGQSSFFRRGALFQNITPGEYSFSATKKDYYDWRKNIKILAKNVAQLYPFMLPKEPTLTLISAEILKDSTTVATSTKASTTEHQKASPNPIYKEVAELFVPLPAPKIRSTNTDSMRMPGDPKEGSVIISKEKVDIWYEGSNIFARWKGQIESVPVFFCEENECSEKILVYTAPSPITHIDFLPSRNDVIIFSSSNGIYAVEINKTQPQNIQPLYKKSANFRVSDDGLIYIKYGKNYYLYEM